MLPVFTSFQWLQFCRKNKLRGGSVIFIKSHVTYNPVPALSSLAAKEVFEVSACIVKYYETFLICLYRVPDKSNLNIVFDRINTLLSMISSLNLDTVMTSDFNIDFKSSCVECKELNSLIYGLNVILKDEITSPGVINDGTCIDNEVTKFLPTQIKVEVTDIGCSDHNAVKAKMQV